MAGIYIHIPFCKSKCYYCDFFSVASGKQKDSFLRALVCELQLRADFFKGEAVNTIYFGGGTPSVLAAGEIALVLSEIRHLFDVHKDAEVTLEANPDDISVLYLQQLQSVGINRLSIGVQSLQDDVLRWLNRRHSGEEAVNSVRMALDTGFSNVSVDIIYGIPGLSQNTLKKDIETLLDLPFHHLSAYMLSIEENTVLSHHQKKGLFAELGEDEAFLQFKTLLDTASDHGFEQYEISNFARKGMYSKHNTAYWQQKKYLGAGPAAHSYNGEKRLWNVKNLTRYIQEYSSESPNYEEETLGYITRYNEYILTSLRTKWGVNPDLVRQQFGNDLYDSCLSRIKRYIASNDMIPQGQSYRLTEKGMFISDYIIEDFFLV